MPYLWAWRRKIAYQCGGPRVSKGLTSNVPIKPLLTRGLLQKMRELFLPKGI